MGGSSGAIARPGPRKISAFQQILQNQRLQKRDSKSLDIVASKLMEEKYGGYEEADEDKSKSLDDGIFCGGDKNSDDNSSDEQINLIDKKMRKMRIVNPKETPTHSNIHIYLVSNRRAVIHPW